jgi:MoaA/NifB/PqqE/SkfB family radical SAM enzyme
MPVEQLSSFMWGPLGLKHEMIKNQTLKPGGAIMNPFLATIYNKNRILLGYFKHGFFGEKIWLDASSQCQLKCPLCSTAKKQTGITGSGYLKFEDFRNFVQKHPLIKRIELSNWGEIFLNPDLEKILEHGYSHQIKLTANNGVNFNSVSDALIEALVKYQMQSMLVSIDGATQSTYQQYRIGGNLQKVIENIERLNFYKHRYNQKIPVLKWQFILFGHNEHELPTAKKMARDLGMKFNVKLNGDPDYSPIKNINQAVAECGYESWNDYLEQTGSIRNHSCYQLWETPVINWDGKLVGCCRNRYDHFGNVFIEGIGKCIRSEKYLYTKKMLMGKAPPRDDIPCMSCQIFNVMRSRKIYVQPYQKTSLKKQVFMRLFYQ